MSDQSPSVRCENCEDLWCDVNGECKELSDDEQDETYYERWFEAYKSLTFWNKHDNDAVLGFDRIFIPVSVGLPALAKVLPLATNNASATEPHTATHIIATVASLVLLTFWFFLSLRYRQSIDMRYNMMQKIECKLHFCAHRYYHNIYQSRRKNRKWWKPCTWYVPRDRNLRIYFYVPVVFLLGWYMKFLLS